MLAMHFGTIFATCLHQVEKTQKLQRFYTKNQKLAQKGLLVENTLGTRFMNVKYVFSNVY